MKTNKLVFSTFNITDDHIYGGINYDVDINPDSVINVGTVASVKLQFTTDLLGSSSPGQEFTYYTVENNVDTSVGKFIITEAVKSDYGKYNITAYDLINKFEKIVDSWWSNWWTGTGYTKNINTLLSSLCTECGVTNSSTVPINNITIVEKPVDASNLSGKTVLAWIAQLTASNITCDNNGQLKFIQFTTAKTLNNTQYSKFTFADYTVPVIDKVHVMKESGDVGVSYGTGDNVLEILDNPLMYTATSTECQNIYNVVNLWTYTPATIELLEDNNINVGDKVTVTDRNSNSYVVFIMSLSKSNKGVDLESVGAVDRSTANAEVAGEMTSLTGKYNILKRDLDSTVSRIGTAEGNITALTQTVDGIETEVTDARGSSSTLKQRIDSIESSVTRGTKTYKQSTEPTDKAEGDLWYYTGTTTSSYTNGVWYRYNSTTEEWESTEDPQVVTNTSTISQQADKISLVVTEKQGEDVINSAEITAALNTINGQTTSDIKVTADNITMTGTTTFLTKSQADTYYDENGAAEDVKDGLATSGYTTINGGNIITGTLSADSISGGTITGVNMNLGNKLVYTDSSQTLSMTGVTVQWTDVQGHATVDANIATAQSTADDAKDTADDAKDTADDAKDTADDASTTATTANNQVNNWKYTGTTYIDGSKIYTGSITADKIASANYLNLRGYTVLECDSNYYTKLYGYKGGTYLLLNSLGVYSNKDLYAGTSGNKDFYCTNIEAAGNIKIGGQLGVTSAPVSNAYITTLNDHDNPGSIAYFTTVNENGYPGNIAHFNNFCVHTTTTTSNAYCGFSSSKYLQKYSGSSRRHKNSILPLSDDYYDKIHGLYNLEVKRWKYNNDYLDENDELYNTETIGLIAEDVNEVFPELVVHDNGEIDNYRDRQLINAMLVLIQEQHQEIESLKQRVEALEND